MQVKADRDYQQAMEIWSLNRDQLLKARASGRQKSTILTLTTADGLVIDSNTAGSRRYR